MTKYAKCSVCGYVIAIYDDTDASDYVCPVDGTTLVVATRTEYMVTEKSAATFVVAASDSLHKERADYVCPGVDDQVVIQAVFDELKALERGTIHFLEGTYRLGTNGITLLDMDDFTLDFSSARILYGGTGVALSVGTEIPAGTPAALAENINIQGGCICAVGGAVSSDTAIGLQLSQTYRARVRLCLENFKEGIGVRLHSKNCWCERNSLDVDTKECKIGIFLKGPHTGAFNRIEHLSWNVWTVVSGGRAIMSDFGAIGLIVDDLVCWCHNVPSSYGIYLADSHAASFGTLVFDIAPEDFVGINTLNSTNVTVNKVVMYGDGYIFGSPIRVNSVESWGHKFALPGVVGHEPAGQTGKNVVNGLFERDISQIGESTCTCSYETPGKASAGCLGLIATHSSTYQTAWMKNFYPATGGKSYTISLWVKSGVDNAYIKPNLAFYDKNQDPLEGDYNEPPFRINESTLWTSLWSTIHSPGDARFFKFCVSINMPDTESMLNIDGISVSGPDYETVSIKQDLFMDVLGVSTTHVVNNWDVHGAGEIELEPAANNQPDVHRTLSWDFVQHTNVTEFDLIFTGIDARGNTTTETFTEADGWSSETNNAFAIITSIIYTRRVGAGDVGNILDIGITDVLGLSNQIREAENVFKIKKNAVNKAVATAQVNTTYDTYDMTVIGLAATDDFTIWYKSNLNIIS